VIQPVRTIIKSSMFQLSLKYECLLTTNPMAKIFKQASAVYINKKISSRICRLELLDDGSSIARIKVFNKITKIITTSNKVEFVIN